MLKNGYNRGRLGRRRYRSGRKVGNIDNKKSEDADGSEKTFTEIENTSRDIIVHERSKDIEQRDISRQWQIDELMRELRSHNFIHLSDRSLTLLFVSFITFIFLLIHPDALPILVEIIVKYIEARFGLSLH